MAFVSARTGNAAIYSATVWPVPDGDTFVLVAEQLTDPPAPMYDEQPAWSPDGTRIAFVRSFVDGLQFHPAISVMNADGTGQTRLTDAPEWEGSPVWSPDGTRIAFVRGPGIGAIWTIRADGSDLRDLSGVGAADDWFPRWSPDGTRIAFLRGDVIWVMNADGTGQRQLTDGEYDHDQAWSPDGTRIAFTRGEFVDRAHSLASIYVVNSDGSGIVRLTNESTLDMRPMWSPDGTRILFERSPSDINSLRSDIYLMDAAGGGVVALTGAPSNNYLAVWSPDGTLIAFTTAGDVYGLAIMRADGTGLTVEPGAIQATWR